MYKFVILSCVVALSSAGALIGGIAPWAYSAPYEYSPLTYLLFYNPSNYRGPLSLAPGQPANILGSDGRPLDTLDVNLDRSAHLTAKALDKQHILKKRSVSAPVFTTAVLPTPLYAPQFPRISSGVVASPIGAFNYPYAAAYTQW